MGSSSTKAHAPISPSGIFYTQRGLGPCGTLRHLHSTLCCLQLYLLLCQDYCSNFCCPTAFPANLCSPTGCRQQSLLPSVFLQYPQQLIVSHQGHHLSLMLETGMRQYTPMFMQQQPAFIVGRPLLQELQISHTYIRDWLGS